MKQIHLIEPTLWDETGHCHGYVQSLIQASAAIPCEIIPWIDRRGKALFHDMVACRGFFSRRLRKIQALFLYRRLLKSGQTIFIPTAGRTDLLLLHYASVGIASNAPVYLHFHQFTRSAQKLALLKRLAGLHPNFRILAPTPGLLQLFRDAGFQHCHCVPCPSYLPTMTKFTGTFQHVLFAGAARMDKGFQAFVDFVALLQQQGESIPVNVQVSPPHTGVHHPAVAAAIKQLNSIAYDHINMVKTTLSYQDYQSNFRHGICLAPYDSQAYHDKFSGVTLDALYAGCPVVATAGTWMGDTIARFGAGIVVAERSPQVLLQAVKTIMADYSRYQQQAMKAGEVLAYEHHPARTLEVLQD